MERQTSLIKKSSKEEQLKELFSNLDMYSKIIVGFGNINSKIMFLGIAPMQSHMDSSSKSCFKFDEDVEVNAKSGAVLIKVFKKLNLKIEDYFWDNIFKIPIEKVTNRQLFCDIMGREIDILKPDMIITLGNECYNIVKSLDINVNIICKKIIHPGFLLRGGITFDRYLEGCQGILKQNGIKEN